MLHQHRKWWPYTNDYNDECVVLFCVTFLELKLLEKEPIRTSDLYKMPLINDFMQIIVFLLLLKGIK